MVRGKEVSDDDDVSTDDSEGDVSEEEEEEEEGTEVALICAMREIHNRTSRHIGMASMEERHFCEFLEQIFSSQD